MTRSYSQLREDSRNALAGSYGLCFTALFVMFVLYAVLNQAVYLIPYPRAVAAAFLTSILVSIAASFVMTTLQAGFTFLTLNVARYGRPSFNDLFLAYRYDTSKAMTLCLILGAIDTICMLPASYGISKAAVSLLDASQGTFKNLPAAAGILLTGILASVILAFIFAFPFSQALPLYIDHQELSALACLARSRDLMRGQRVRFLLLHLSFAGYFVLCVVSLGIGLIWVYPYFYVTKANYYMDLTGNYKPY